MQKTLRQLMDDIAQIEAGYTKPHRLNSFNFYQGTYNEDSSLDEVATQGGKKWPTAGAEIRAFQQANPPLKVDGLIGQATLAKLQQLGYVAPKGFTPVASKSAVPGAAPTAPPAGSADPATSPSANGAQPVYSIDAKTMANYSPEAIQARNNGNFFRVARDWKDGTPPPNPDGDYASTSGKVQRPEIMKIEADQQWAATDGNKIFVNYDGTPIVSQNKSTWPTDPKHPYYHFVFTGTSGEHGGKIRQGQRYDPLRWKLSSLLKKDIHGKTQLDYRTPNKVCPVVGGNVPGYTQGNVQNVWGKLKFSEYGHELQAGWVGSQGGALMLSWIPMTFTRPDEIDQALLAAVEEIGDEARGIWEKYHDIGKVSKLAKISFPSPFGNAMGNQFVATKGKISWHFACGNVFVRSQSASGPHVDQITIYYFGPSNEWASTGSSGMAALCAGLKLVNGVEPLAKITPPVNEELAQLIKLAKLT